MAGISGNNRLPKDAQVIVSMLKEAGINDFEPRVVNQLLEFTYRYVTGVLDEARVYAQHAKKKVIDLEDVKLASMLQLDRSFTSPPPRDMLMDVAKSRNSGPLPVIKPHYGLRLPPDRHCLSACNYKLKSNKKVPGKTQINTSLLSSGSRMSSAIGNRSSGINVKVSGASNPSNMSLMQSSQPARTKVMTTPKPVIKFNPSPGVMGGTPSSTLPKIHISGSTPSSSIQHTSPPSMVTNVPQSAVSSNIPVPMDVDATGMKRKREPDDPEFDAIEQM